MSIDPSETDRYRAGEILLRNNKQRRYHEKFTLVWLRMHLLRNYLNIILHKVLLREADLVLGFAKMEFCEKRGISSNSPCELPVTSFEDNLPCISSRDVASVL